MPDRQLLRAILGTYGSQIIGALAGIIAIRLCAELLTVKEFGALLTARRFIGIALPIITINFSLSLARFISKDSTNRYKYLLLSYIGTLILWSSSFIFFLFFKNRLTLVLFDDLSFSPFFTATLFYLLASGIQIVAVGYWRGSQKFNQMNILNLAYQIISIILLVGLILLPNYKNNSLIIYFYGYAILIVLINIFVAYLGRFGKKPELIRSMLKIKADYKGFIAYGWLRLPGGVFYAVLFAIPVFAASHYLSLETAAYAGIIITIANLIFLIGYPLNLIFVPLFSNMSQKKSTDLVRKDAKMVFGFANSLPLLIGPMVLLFSREIILLMLGENYLGVVKSLEYFSWAAGVFLAYIILRGLLDGVEDYPYSNQITILGLILFSVVISINFYFGLTLNSIVLSFCSGLVGLYIGATYYFSKIFKLKILNKRYFLSLGWIFTLVGVTYLLKIGLGENHILFFALLIKTIIAGGYIIFSYMFYKKFNYDWTINLSFKKPGRIHEY